MLPWELRPETLCTVVRQGGLLKMIVVMFIQFAPKRNRLKKKKIVKTLGTLFCSTIDPLLIHLLCPLCSWKQMPFLCLLCNDTQSLQPLSLYTPKGVKYNHCSQEIMTSLISVLHSGKGLYLTVYYSSRPNTDTLCNMYRIQFNICPQKSSISPFP